MKRYLVISTVLLSCSAAFAQDFKVIVAQPAAHRAPKDFNDHFRDVMNSPIGEAAIRAAATYIGVPQSAVSAAKAIVNNYEARDEETRISFSYEPGWTFCKVLRTERVGFIPNSGDKASVLSGTAQSNSWGFYAWTPKGYASSHAEAIAEILFVRNEVARQHRNSGRCVNVKGNNWEVRIFDFKGGDKILTEPNKIERDN